MRGREAGDPAADDHDVRSRRPARSRVTGSRRVHRSTTRASTSGSVSGSTPWPRLNTCPGSPRAAVEHRADLRPRRAARGASSDGRVEVALQRDARSDPARRPRRAAPGSRRRPRRRRPRPSAPSSSPVPTPKWIRGTAARSAAAAPPRPAPRPSAAARTRGSPPATARRPTSRTAAPRSTPARPARAGTSPAIRGQPVEQVVPQLRVAVHQRLGALVVAARAALDQVGRQRERRAGEADQRRRRRARRPAAAPPRATGSTASVARAGAARRARRASRIGVGDHRADARHDVQVDADRLERHHDVAEQDRRVDAVAADRLQGDLGDQVGPQARVEHRRCPSRGRAVLRQRAAGLPHEPHRRVRHRLAPAGAQERRARQAGGSRRSRRSRVDRRTRDAVTTPPDGDQGDAGERRDHPDVLHRPQPLAVHEPGRSTVTTGYSEPEHRDQRDQAAAAGQGEQAVGGGVAEPDDGEQRDVPAGQPAERCAR